MLSTLSIGVGEHLAAGATERTRPNEVTATMFCSGAILTGLVALFWQGDPTTADLVFGGVAGIANGVAILMLYAAYSRGSLRSTAPVAAIVMTSVPVAWDVVVTGTAPSTLVWTGIGLGIAAIGLSSYQPGGVEDERFGIQLAIAAGIAFGVLLILLGEIGDDAGGTPIFVQRSVGFVVAAAVARATGPRIFPAVRDERRGALTIGVFATTAVILLVAALQVGGCLAVVSVIGSQYAAVAVLLGVVFEGQRLRWTQTVGLIAASLAVALITVG